MDATRYKEELRRRERLIEQMTETIGRQERTIRRQEATIAAQTQELARLNERVCDLEAVLERRAKAKQSKPPHFTGDYSLRTQERKGRRRKRPRSPGRRKTREKLDRAERIENVYPEGVPPERCQFDRARLAWRIENGRAVLVCYRLYKAPWGEQLARVPDLLPRSDYGLEVAIILAFLVYTTGVSIHQARSLLAFFCRLDLSRSQADALLSQLSRLWQQDFQTLCEIMARATVIYLDETGWKVSTRNCYAWVFTTLSHTILLYGRGRDAAVLDEILPEDFGGIGVSDDYAVYRNRFSRGQKCWAHYLRKAIALMLAHPEQTEYRRFFEQLLALYRDGKRSQQDRRLADAGREQRVLALEDRLYALCSRWLDELTDDTPQDVREFVNLQKALMRAMGDEELFTFVLVPEVEATNNRPERTFRFTAEQRKTNRTSKSEAGAHRRTVITSVLISLRQNLSAFTLESVVQEVTRWCIAGTSLFREQLDAICSGLSPPQTPSTTSK